MNTLWIVLACIGAIAAWGSVEAIRLRRSLRRIPLRIHVNGTRGKSSVTRLIAAALREAGIRTVAKTTGTLPRIILPDGSEQPIERIGRANVIEQRDVAFIASQLGAEALVVECMALQPQLQSLCERRLVRATHGVITNCRADHLDIMGPSEHDVASALANTTPIGGKLFTAETCHLCVLQEAAEDRRTKLIATGPEEVEEITDLEMAGFRCDEHKENVALALRLCRELGIERSVALRGMQGAQPDPGATTSHLIEFYGRQISFVNAFAANDPASTLRAWERALEYAPEKSRRIAILNCRFDRLDRSLQMARAIATWQPPDHVVLVGSGTNVFERAALAAGMAKSRLVAAERCDVAELFELIVELAGPSAVVVGMGNIGECGLEIVRYFRNRSRVTQAVVWETPVPAVLADRMPDTNDAHTILQLMQLEASGVGIKQNGHGAYKTNGTNGTKIANDLLNGNGDVAEPE